MGNSFLPPALGWVGRWRPRIQKEKKPNIKIFASAVCCANLKTKKNFLFLFQKKLGARH
jgi:hypothetical protein